MPGNPGFRQRMAAVIDEPPRSEQLRKNSEIGAENTSGKSYAALLRSNLPSTLNKNVIEIALEEDYSGAFIVSVEDCARLLVKLGIDPKPGVHVESVQICPNGRGVVFVTLKQAIPIE